MSAQRHWPISAQQGWAWRALVSALCGLLCLGMAEPPVTHAQPAAQQATPLGWQPLGGPLGSISHLSAEPGTTNLYAAVQISARRRDDQTQWLSAGTTIRSAALYRSEDGGATWRPATNNLIPGPITALFADQVTGILYAGLQGAETGSVEQTGLWSSADQGDHWQSVPLGRDGLLLKRISRNAQGTHLLLGATAASSTSLAPSEKPNSYVLRSVDGGATWESSRVPLDEGHLDSVLVDLIPHPSAPDRLFVTTNAGEIYASNDLGVTWQVALTGNPAPASQPTPQTDASSAQNGSATIAAYPTYLAIAADRPDTLLAARVEPNSGSTTTEVRLALLRSTDGGANWSPLPTTGLPAQALPNTLAALPGGIYLLNTSYGTYRSTDAGTTWQLLEGPLSSGDVAAFVAVPESTHSVVAASAYGLFMSKDAGAIWQPLGEGLPFNSNLAGLITDARAPSRIFAITYAVRPHEEPTQLAGPEPVRELRPPMLLRSADGGVTWTPASQGLPGVAPMAWALDPNDPNTLFISSRAHLFRTTDGGLNWQTMRLPAGGHYAIAIAPSDSDVVYLGGNPPLRSVDRGATWQVLTPIVAGAPSDVTGLVIDLASADHVWASIEGGGVYESQDGGGSWRSTGLTDRPVRWLASASGPFTVYAGVTEDGIYRWDPQASAWTTASNGLPAKSTILAFAADPRQPGTLWAGRDGGGIYRSADSGGTWTNVSGTTPSAGRSGQSKNEVGIGDNLVQALAIDHTGGGYVFLGTATAGLWALRPQDAQTVSAAPRAVDARIQVVWPHDSAPVPEARLANIGLRLFAPDSLLQPPCGWSPRVTVWKAEDSNPAEPLEDAEQRTVDGHPFPVWELNDVDVSYASDPQHKLYFMIEVLGIETATSIWTHGSDPRTYYPFPEVPSGVAAGDIDAVDARIQVVWPHDAEGNPKDTSEAAYANISVALFKHGTRLSVPIGWHPAGLTLNGAWNQEIGQPVATEATTQVRKAGAITYPTWEFNNIPVDRAMDSTNKLHLWVSIEGVDTYPSIWTHGADARTLFPAKDEPVQGCVP
jgi:photosystem II stability/assembly factor-like uncharacterized protein